MGDDNPIAKAVKWLTEGKEDTPEKTRIMSKEQIEFTYAYEFAGVTLGCDWMVLAAKMDNRLMEAYKGLRSDDVVALAVGLKEAEEKEKGLRAVKKAEDAATKRVS